MSTVPVAVEFNDKDIEYLAATFSFKQLRHEIHHADIEASVARQFGEAAVEAYWRNYIATLKATLELSKATPSTQYRYRHYIDVPALKAQIDIVDTAGWYTVLKRSACNFTGLCPIHSETRPSFYVYPDQQSWHCFGACNTGGDVISLIMAVEKVDFYGAVSLLEAKL